MLENVFGFSVCVVRCLPAAAFGRLPELSQQHRSHPGRWKHETHLARNTVAPTLARRTRSRPGSGSAPMAWESPTSRWQLISRTRRTCRRSGTHSRRRWRRRIGKSIVGGVGRTAGPPRNPGGRPSDRARRRLPNPPINRRIRPSIKNSGTVRRVGGNMSAKQSSACRRQRQTAGNGDGDIPRAPPGFAITHRLNGAMSGVF